MMIAILILRIGLATIPGIAQIPLIQDGVRLFAYAVELLLIIEPTLFTFMMAALK